MYKHRQSFTLIEMLIVVATIGLLAVALIPKLQGTQVRARNAGRLSDATQIYKALKIYAGLNGGQFPQYATGLEGGYITSLPSDPAQRNACTRRVNSMGGRVIDYPTLIRVYRGGWTAEETDPHNYYPGSKGYYYNQLVTGDALSIKIRTSAVIGVYMEYESKNIPVSNILYSNVRARGFGTSSTTLETANGCSCFDQAIRASMGFSSPLLQYGGGSLEVQYPEAIQDPNVISQAYYSFRGGGSAWGTSGGPGYVPYTEGDYIMLATP